MMPPADADGLRAAGNMTDHHRRSRARNARHAVMFGQPVAVIAKRLGMSREIERIGQ
jgi:hypothetical protein